MDTFYIGIDFGGTCIRVASGNHINNDRPNMLKKVIVRNKTAEEELERNLIPLIEENCIMQKNRGKQLGGIGIAMAALFDRNTGVITDWPNNKKYKGFPVRSYLEERYKVPVSLEDDANAAVLGERLLGAGMGLSDMIYVTISTGIGCGIIVNDKLITGYHGWAGELGHIKVTDENILCTCGARGCLQAVASGTAIFRDIQLTEFYRLYKKAGNLTLKDCVEYAKQGNAELVSIFQRAGNYIGESLANMVMLLDIPVIILGGGVMEAGDVIWEPIRNAVNKNLENKRAVNIVCSSLNDSNGVLGALYLAGYSKQQKRSVNAES